MEGTVGRVCWRLMRGDAASEAYGASKVRRGLGWQQLRKCRPTRIQSLLHAALSSSSLTGHVLNPPPCGLSLKCKLQRRARTWRGRGCTLGFWRGRRWYS